MAAKGSATDYEAGLAKATARVSVSPMGEKAREIAAAEPVSTKVKKGKTANPLAPERVAAILDALEKTYPKAVCALNHRSAWELLVATILSAQCTDVRVNLATPALFKAFPTPKAMAAASLPELEALIRTTGFFRNKAKSIKGAARVVTEEFGGEVPQTMEELLRIPGVARKTANVVLGSWFGIAVGVVVDTHVLRISRRLELTKETDAGEGGAGPDAGDSAGEVDRVLARGDLPRTADLRGAEAAVRRTARWSGCATRRTRRGVRTEAGRA